ncbi:hypothetical protein QRQ56_34815 [Bradyrhizobium sp. U531]|uniref:hypothetical protein n=1 Tax=Bradyrhizobium sp. U531 TaxID=3053458 RepID=UPI003F442D12
MAIASRYAPVHKIIFVPPPVHVGFAECAPEVTRLPDFPADLVSYEGTCAFRAQENNLGHNSHRFFRTLIAVQTGKDGMALVEHSFGPVLVIRVWSVLFSSTTDLLRAKPQLFGNERSEVRSICL